MGAFSSPAPPTNGAPPAAAPGSSGPRLAPGATSLRGSCSAPRLPPRVNVDLADIRRRTLAARPIGRVKDGVAVSQIAEQEAEE
eukprot:731396-Prymnesium_polylepis.1